MNKFFRSIFITFLFLISIILAGATLLIGSKISSAEDVYLDTMKLDLTSFIYYTDAQTGKEVEYDRLYDSENRIWVDYKDIPKNMINAFVSVEDERFYDHHGFDIKRLIGAVTTFISKGDSSYGASTITQQLVKNLSGDDDVTIERKLQEIYRSVKIELVYSKEEILEFYLNTIFLSRQCNGVQAAAKRYFNKDVNELSLAEITSIAGITQYPSRYDPISNPESNEERRRVVLIKMKELGYISGAELNEALSSNLTFCQEDTVTEEVKTKSYFADAVINEVLADLIDAGYAKQVAMKMLYAGGIKIYCTMNPEIQGIIDEVYSNDKNFPASYGNQTLQSSMIITDPYKGFVLGMAGGRGNQNGRMTLNRATQTLRQPGSAIKPIAVYAPALEYGIISPSSIILDAPININGWAPKNSDNKFHGAVTAKNALTRSLNIPAVKVLQRLTVDESYNFLENSVGITSLVENREVNGKTYSDKNFSSLSLGGLTDGVSVMEMAGAFGIFPNHGVYKKPTTYVRVEDHNGKIILGGEDKGKRAISEENAFLMTDMLINVVRNGTGTGAALSNIKVAGKTGSSTADKDRWFVGYTPYYVGAVWFGYDQPKSFYAPGNPSATIWRKVMSKVHENLENKAFERSGNAIDGKVKVCKVSGKLATALCELDIRGSMVKSMNMDDPNLPTEKCTLHKEYFICTKSDLRAHEGCEGSRKRVSALGIENGEHTAKDGYVPSKLCDEHKVVTYSACTETGLLAGPYCKSVINVKSNPESKPKKVCDKLHEGNEMDGNSVRAPEAGVTPEEAGSEGSGEHTNPPVIHEPVQSEDDILIE